MIVAFNEVPAKASFADEATPSGTLTDLLLAAFDSAAVGSRVWGSIFQWSDEQLTRALEASVRSRQLRLQLVAGDRDHAFQAGVASFFRRRVRRGGVFRRRPLGTRRNHDKWFLFEALDFEALQRSLPAGAEVVADFPAPGWALLVSTANLTEADRLKNNAAVLVPVGPRLAVQLQHRFEILRWCYRCPSLLAPLAEALFRRFRFAPVELERFVLHSFPGRAGYDPIRETIARIVPAAGPVHIRVCNIRWTRTGVAQALLDLHRAAPETTQIEIIARSPQDWVDLDEDGLYERTEMSAAVATRLSRCATRYWQRHDLDARGEPLTTSGRDRDGNPIAVPRSLAAIHGKYALIDAYFQQDTTTQRRRLLWIGSPNMTRAAVESNFEILLEFKSDAGAYEAFARNFERLKTLSERGGLGATDPAVALVVSSSDSASRSR